MSPKEEALWAGIQRGDATAAATLWRSIASGLASDEIVLLWAREVAQQVVAKVLDSNEPANRRAEKARIALGLEGPIDKNPELRQLVEEVGDAYSASELASVADLLVHFEDCSPQQLKRKIEHIKRSLRTKKSG